MARKLRIEYEGAFYHVITRGNQRQKIFGDTRTIKDISNSSLSTRTATSFFLYAYVLMGTMFTS